RSTTSALLNLGLTVSAPASSAQLDFSIIGRQFGTAFGEDWIFALSLDATDVIHTGDQLKIAFLPFVDAGTPFPVAVVVNQVLGSSGLPEPPCTVCATLLGFGPTGANPFPFFAEQIRTPLTKAE